MSSRTRSDFVQGQATKSAVAFVELWTVDLAGRLRGLTLSAAQLEQALEDGVPIAASALGVPAARAADPLVLFPDASTWGVLPDPSPSPRAATAPPPAAPVARLLCDVLAPDGAPSPWDTRGVLKRALGRAAALGYAFYAGAVVEHHLLAGGDGPPRPLDQGHAHGLSSSPERTRLAHATVRALEQLGVVTGPLALGPGPGQLALALAWTDALALADALVTHKRVTRDLALAHGRAATFMPFPFADLPGNALALALDLHEAGATRFADPGEPGARSATARRFAAGLDAHAPALSLVARPTVNSYTHPIATLAAAPPSSGRDEDAQLPYRGADPSANPYLLLAGLLDAGLDGLASPHAAAPPAAPAPTTLAEAAAEAERSALLRRTFGAELLGALAAAARAECAADLRQVTPWELARYLDPA